MTPRGRGAAAVAAAVAVVVAVAVLVLLLRGGESGDTDAAAEAPRPAEPSDIDRTIEEVRAFVSEVRELEWLRDVEVELADDEEFRRRLLEDAIEDREELEQDAAVLRALQLVARDVDLYDVLIGFLGDSVIGFYDPETDELVLRGTSLTPYVRSTLAHELTHALDDQHFELHRPALDDAVDESALAFAAVVEGNAVRVETRYVETMSAEERDQLREEELALAAGIDLARVPPIVPALIGFPYIFGEQFVAAVHDEGGERAVDRALREPPTTSEQILDPSTWIQRQPILAVEAPAADGEVIDEGGYGQYTLQLTLATELGRDDAADAATGWGGDAYVAWTDPDRPERTCVRAVFAMDTARDLEELAVALRDWTQAHADAAVERPARDRVGFVACG